MRLWRWIKGLFRPLPLNGGTDWREVRDVERRVARLEEAVSKEVAVLQRRK